MEAYMGDNEVIIQVGNSRKLTIVSTETTKHTSVHQYSHSSIVIHRTYKCPSVQSHFYSHT